MIRLAYPNKKLSAYALIAGGCANLNFKILLENETQPLVLRVYLRDKDATYREQNIGKIVKQTVRVAQTYYIGKLNSYAFAITEFISGFALRNLLLSAAPHDLSTIMNEVGTILAKIAFHQFSEAGLLDKELRIIPYESFDILKLVNSSF